MTTAVFVHGVPETPAIWAPLVRALRWPDVAFLSPPGFGAAVPGGFGATVEEYRAWLVEELERFGSPVHLVGHDWGGAHVVNVAMTRPELLRSWTSDAIGLFDPDFVWHDHARVWQTEGVGERAVAEVFGPSPDERAAFLIGLGMPSSVAAEMVGGHDPAMGRAILALYRSAAQPVMARLGENLERAAQRPGLCVLATDDPVVGSAEIRRRSARRAGASVAVLDGAGHWWPTDPSNAAAALTDFWHSVP